MVVNPEKSQYVSGAPVELKAVAQTGYLFVGWSGDAGGTNNPVSVTMDKARIIAANFKVGEKQPPVVKLTLPSAGTTDDDT